MSELPENATGSTPAAAPHSAPPAESTPQKPYWLYRFAAWVGIVAGIVFIAATIFFSGAALTDHGESHCHHHPGHHHSMGHPGHHHRGHGPVAPGTDEPGPGQPPQSVTPPPPPPGR